MVLELVATILRKYLFEKDIICFNDLDLFISDEKANVFFLLYYLVIIIPAFVIPYVFYYIPVMKSEMAAQ